MILPTQLVDVFSLIPMGSHSGRNTPTSACSLSSAANGSAIDATVLFVAASETSLTVLDPDKMATKEAGREKGAAAYSAVEHVALLSITSEVPDAFNTGESSPQLATMYKRMVEEFYSSGNVRQSSTLHGHFAELYSSFKLGIRNFIIEG
jgi:hypothetical protein